MAIPTLFDLLAKARRHDPARSSSDRSGPRRRRAVIDNFCGGGGASTGIERALARIAPGRHVDAAINHDAPAIAMHRANHPETLHYCQSIWKVDPRKVVMAETSYRRRGRSCRSGSASPGSRRIAPITARPRAAHRSGTGSRDLAWVIIRWAKLPKSYRPRVIMMENVEEWLEWSPLRQRVWPKGTELAGQPMFDLKGRPVYERDPDRKGEIFYKWLKKLQALGYQVEWREIRGCDHGAPDDPQAALPAGALRWRADHLARRDAWPGRQRQEPEALSHRR
jgi:DNA (cytosine-5)-methyltransferase 1